MNYPFKQNDKYTKNIIDYRNRGMGLENMINDANKYYLDAGIAVIHKKPTPIGLIDVDYKKGRIKDAYFKEKSTFDYCGVYKGRYIDFEAKESHSKTSFPLSNIHPHQLEHLKSILPHGAIAFLIVSIRDEYYLLKGEHLLEFIANNTRKSIPYEYFKENCHTIKQKLKPHLDYIKTLDEIYFKGE